jgi:hypothetical protein
VGTSPLLIRVDPESPILLLTGKEGSNAGSFENSLTRLPHLRVVLRLFQKMGEGQIANGRVR